MTSMSRSPSDHYIVLSYHDNHRELVLQIYQYLKAQDLPVWIDVIDGIDKEKRKSIAENTSGMVCFITPMYETSRRCQQEMQFAKIEGIPVVVCRLLPNWKPSGWLNKIISDYSVIDLSGIQPRNFKEKVRKLQQKLSWILDNGRNSPIVLDRSFVVEDSDLISCGSRIDSQHWMKQPIHYQLLPAKCRLYLSNRMACSNEYILINANNHLHLFDRNLTLIRSNNDVRVAEGELRDLVWCCMSNSFIVLTSKQIYLMNPLTCKLSTIETMKLSDRLEQFVSCSCSEEKLFLLTYRVNFNTFFYHEYSLTTFRFQKKLKVQDLLGTSLLVQNGSFDKYDIQEMTSIRYFQQKMAMIMRIASRWSLFIFHLQEQPVYLREIQLGGKSRMTVLKPNQWILFNDHPSSSFMQIDVSAKSQRDQDNGYLDCSHGMIDFGGRIRSVALFGLAHLVFLIANTLVLYKI